jgi:hypothetical protein
MSPKYDGNYYCPRCEKWYPAEEILWLESHFEDADGNIVLVTRRVPVCPVHHIQLRSRPIYSLSRQHRQALKSAQKLVK